MTAASVHGVPITPVRAAACRELIAGVASRAAWEELAPLVAVTERVAWGVSPESPGEHTRHPPFGEPYTVTPPTLRSLASCALGSACVRCSTPIESAEAGDGEPLKDGWCCAACVGRERAIETYRRRAATWFRRGSQVGLEPARARRRRR